jgi:hypothetical protein
MLQQTLPERIHLRGSIVLRHLGEVNGNNPALEYGSGLDISRHRSEIFTTIIASCPSVWLSFITQVPDSLLATIGNCAAAYLPVLVEGFDRITQCRSCGDRSDINVRCGIWRQSRDHLLIPIDLIARFVIGAIIPGEVHCHGTAAESKFTCVIIGGPGWNVRRDKRGHWRGNHRRRSICWEDVSGWGSLQGQRGNRPSWILVDCLGWEIRSALKAAC